MSASSRGPTAEGWDNAKPLIRQLYLVEKRQLKDVQQIMERQDHFVATERMYKSRLKTWGFDTKKIREVDWRFMLSTYHRRREFEHKDTEFRVNGRRKTIRDIHKYLKRKAVTPEAFLSSASDSHVQAGIEVFTPKPSLDVDSDSESLSGPPRRSSADLTAITTTPSHPAPPPPPPLPPPPPEPLSTYFHPPMSNAPPPPRTRQRPNLVETAPSPGTRVPAPPGYTTLSPTETSGSFTTSPTSLRAHSSSGSSSTKPYQLVRGAEEMALRAMTPDRISLDSDDELIGNRLLSESPVIIGSQMRRIDHNFHTSDLATTIVQVPTDLSYDEIVTRRDACYSYTHDSLDPPKELDVDQIQAFRWAARYFLACIFTNQKQEHYAARALQNAAEIFEGMLRSQNRFHLTGLSLMSSVLTGHGNDSLLKGFLLQSCQIIDRVYGEDHPISFPYRYMLAVTTEDGEKTRGYGARLHRTTEQFGLVWGNDSPNKLVSFLYWAWHLYETGDLHEAVTQLRLCFAKSEAVMGKNHLVTVNCLATLSRALDRRGDVEDAIAVLSDAVERCKWALGAWNPFRLGLLVRLGMLFWQVGKLDVAEGILWDVVKGRTTYLGLANGHTWGAIEKLSKLLKEQGKHGEEARLQHDMDHLFQKEQDFIAGADAY